MRIEVPGAYGAKQLHSSPFKLKLFWLKKITYWIILTQPGILISLCNSLNYYFHERGYIGSIKICTLKSTHTMIIIIDIFFCLPKAAVSWWETEPHVYYFHSSGIILDSSRVLSHTGILIWRPSGLVLQGLWAGRIGTQPIKLFVRSQPSRPKLNNNIGKEIQNMLDYFDGSRRPRE